VWLFPWGDGGCGLFMVHGHFMVVSCWFQPKRLVVGSFYRGWVATEREAGWDGSRISHGRLLEVEGFDAEA
jgi:hypothetical protein